jgi:hypothetical protein
MGKWATDRVQVLRKLKDVLPVPESEKDRITALSKEKNKKIHGPRYTFYIEVTTFTSVSPPLA